MAAARKKSNKKTIRPSKDIIAPMAEDFRKKLLKLIKEGTKELTIDLKSVEMVDSVGLGIFIAAHNSLENTGGKLRVINMSSDMYNLVQVMRLNEHFEVKAQAN